MKTNIFHSASLRLTAVYIAIIMTISIIFSFWVYNVSITEIRRGIHRPAGPIEIMLRGGDDTFAKELALTRDIAIKEARENLITQLITLNVLIMIGGGFISYYLARKSLQPIEESHQIQSRFISDASHELRTPIAAMRIETEVTLSDSKLNIKDAKKQLVSNIEELDKLTSLSESMLQLASLEQGNIKKSLFSIDKLLDPSIKRIQPNFDNKAQKIKRNIHYKGKININLQSMTEALVTILDNASKYSPEKSTITISASTKGSFVEISVSDEGSGIDEKDMPHIFDRFYRADNSRNKNESAKGYGIGLSIAMATVSSHEGTLKVSNNPSFGATFTIVIPSK